MASITIQTSITGALVRETDGSISLNTGTSGRSFGDLGAFRDWIEYLIGSPLSETAQETLLALLAGWLLAADPTLQNPAAWDAREITLDLGQALATDVLVIL